MQHSNKMMSKPSLTEDAILVKNPICQMIQNALACSINQKHSNSLSKYRHFFCGSGYLDGKSGSIYNVESLLSEALDGFNDNLSSIDFQYL